MMSIWTEIISILFSGVFRSYPDARHDFVLVSSFLREKGYNSMRKVLNAVLGVLGGSDS